MDDDLSNFKEALKRESALFVALLFLGFVLLPIAIYVVGRSLFGEYGGTGYSGFFNILSGKIRSGDHVAWFLVLSPYIAWQTLRLTIYGWRRTKLTRDSGPIEDSRPNLNV